MFGKVFLIILVVGFCDAYLVVLSTQVFTIMGAVGLCVLSAIIGSYLFKREGLRVLKEFQNDLREGKPAVDKLADGVMVLIGGALLITPGYISDLIGFLLMIPFIRKLVKPLLINFAKKNMQIGFYTNGFNGLGQFQQNAPRSNEKDADIIDIK